MRLKKYNEFIYEAQDVADDSAFDGMKDDVEKMIKDTVGDGDVAKFADKYDQNPEQNEIEGLINDDQIYDFWLKYENEIDELLHRINFFEESPDDLNAIGTYKYIIVSTKRAIREVVKMIGK